MALFKPNLGNKENLPTTLTAGWAYFCTDSGEFFIDYADSNGILHRKQINADEANKLVGYDIANVLQANNTQLPTSQAVFNALESKSDVGHNHNDTYYTKTEIDAKAYRLPTASSSTLGGVKIGSNISISSGKISVPEASGTTKGVTIVWPAAQCTTFSSDNGTVTPLAVQKGAKMFAITRPASSTEKAITRYSDTTGNVQNSTIIIEDVVNSRNGNAAQVIAVPASGGKKMVYGYCTDQVDGTSFIGGIFDASATEYPYSEGLAIGGSSGNLLWKGAKVATTADLPTLSKLGITATAAELNYVDGVTSNIQTQLNAKTAKSSVTTATLAAASWSGTAAPYTYTLTVSGVTTTSTQEITPTTNITVEQLAALQAANLQDGGQAANSITLKAFGEKPTIDLPIRIILRKDT